jgi:ribonuclease VapC
MTVVVLDSSAVLAALLGEPGGAYVEPFLNGALIASVNWAEVVQYYARQGVAEPDIRSMLASVSCEVVDFDADLAYDAGLMVPHTRRAGLSLGDRACLALARHTGARTLTADSAWATVADAVGVEVELIRNVPA